MEEPLHFLPTYEHKQWHLLLWGGLFAVSLFIGGVVFVYYQNAPTQDSQISIDSLNNDPDYSFSEVLRKDTKVFLCKDRRATEAACIFVVTYDGRAITDLDISIDSPHWALKPSPDGKYILVIREQEGFLIDTDTLERRVIIQAPAGQELGVYSGFPSFLPMAEWLDNTHVSFSLYKEGSMDDLSPSPLETKVVDINSQTSNVAPAQLPFSSTPLPGVVCNDTAHAICIKDSLYIYVSGTLLPNADPNTFVLLNDAYAKDATHVYTIINGEEPYIGFVAGADIKTFEVLHEYYAKDANKAYWAGFKVEGANPKTFVAFDSWWAKDNQTIFWKRNPFSVDLNPATFVALSHVYLKDANKVYVFTYMDDSDFFIPGADAVTFITVPNQNGYDAQDKNHKYLGGKIVE